MDAANFGGTNYITAQGYKRVPYSPGDPVKGAVDHNGAYGTGEFASASPLGYKTYTDRSFFMDSATSFTVDNQDQAAINDFISNRGGSADCVLNGVDAEDCKEKSFNARFCDVYGEPDVRVDPYAFAFRCMPTNNTDLTSSMSFVGAPHHATKKVAWVALET